MDVAALLSLAAQRHHLPAEALSIDLNVPSWHTDKERLDRVLDNLLHNARKHGGGVTGLTASYRENTLLIDVDDAGPGIPLEERSVVFDRFARGRSAHARGGSGGTGLGLAIVTEHLAAVSGWVEILDRPGGGGRFRVHLPKIDSERTS